MDTPTTPPLEESWKLNGDYNRVADFLGLDLYDRQNNKIARKVSTIHDYVSKGSKDLTSVLGELYKIKKSLGSPHRGSQLVDELFQSVKLQSNTARITHSDKPLQVAESKMQKSTPVQKAVAQGVQKVVNQTLNEMVKKALTDKKIIAGAIEQSVKEALK